MLPSYLCLLHHCSSSYVLPLEIGSSHALIASFLYELITAFLAEFGDPNKKCWVHAVSSIPLHILDEHILSFIWNLQFRSIYICKVCSCLFMFLWCNCFNVMIVYHILHKHVNTNSLVRLYFRSPMESELF